MEQSNQDPIFVEKDNLKRILSKMYEASILDEALESLNSLGIAKFLDINYQNFIEAYSNSNLELADLKILRSISSRVCFFTKDLSVSYVRNIEMIIKGIEVEKKRNFESITEEP